MKARIKATGEIVDAAITQRVTHTGEQVYMTHEGCLIEESRLDFNVEPFDYWTRLEHKYAGMAMQGIVMNEKMQEDLYKAFGKNESMDVTISEFAIDIAHTLVEKLKEKEERK